MDEAYLHASHYLASVGEHQHATTAWLMANGQALPPWVSDEDVDVVNATSNMLQRRLVLT